EYRENNPTPEKDKGQNSDYYPSCGNGRNLAFVWPDGKMQFFNYSYIVTSSYSPHDGTIVLEFSTHRVEVKGHKLEQLFYELMTQAIKVIRCLDSRYEALDSNAENHA